MSIIDTSNLLRFQSEARSLLGRNAREPRLESDQGASNAAAGDRVTLGQKEPGAVTYGGAAQEADLASPYELLRSRLVTLLQEQGVAVQVATGSGDVDIASLTPQAAQELIAEDGYFGVEQTSERIFQFATGLAGNDPSRLDEILQGIEDGFAEAERIWGGTLPEISYQTKDALVDKIDRWLEGSGGGR